MAKVGIAWATTLINTSFPAHDKNFSFHPWILFHTQSFKYAKALVFYFPTCTGNPKYSLVVSHGICSTSQTSSMFLVLILVLKRIANLDLLIICRPEHHSYRSRMCCSCVASSLFAWTKIKESSAKTRREMFGAAWHTLTHEIRLSCSALFSNAEKPSKHKRKR
jgi:hypothetical protein